ncbi:DUF4193 domain-containing protein [Kitasatospora aureofaciens]|uniref:DUF4193 domain-containing protein n=1 Tax=Kitasatospora aureofaciens TaxID=1894 RepID=UPI0033D899CF
MATDYDAPRRDDMDEETDSLEELKDRREHRFPREGGEDAEEPESVELPGADLSNEELTVPVVPPKRDEFVCTVCFTVHHRSQLAGLTTDGQPVCRDCRP